MNTTTKQIEALAEKFSRQFTRRIPSTAHLLADLKQEAMVAIWTRLATWRPDGGANQETYTKIYAWRAMQVLSARQSGPVGRGTVGSDCTGTGYSCLHSTRRHSTEEEELSEATYETEYMDHLRSDATPDAVLERKQADEIVREFVNRRTEKFSGKGKLSISKIKNALQDLMSGDSCTEIGPRYGVSKQYISSLAAEAGIA